MNNPDDIAIDENAEREWLREYKDRRGVAWRVLGTEIGINHSTLSVWVGGSYQARGDWIAKKVFQYRQTLDVKQAHDEADQSAGLGDEPDFIVTPTAQRLRTLMHYAHRGHMTVGATGPGTSKSTTARDFANSLSNVFLITSKPSTRKLAAMVADVARKVSGRAPTGHVRQLSRQIIDQLTGRNALLIFDEANHMEFEALEELRGWHDEIGVGICLLGNEELIHRIRSGGGKHALARLNSRIAMRHIQDLPQTGDVEMYLDAWGVTSADQRRELLRVAMTPGAGGLREVKQIISNAKMLAFEDGVALQLSHIKEAQSTRSTSVLRHAV